MNTVSSTVLRNGIVAATAGKWADSNNHQTYLGLWDTSFFLPGATEMADYASSASTMFHHLDGKPQSEGFDCEDYAFLFSGVSRLRAAITGGSFSVAVGLAIGKFSWRSEEHCCNWIALSTGGGGFTLAWFEPQDIITYPGPLRLHPFSNQDFGGLKVMLV